MSKFINVTDENKDVIRVRKTSISAIIKRKTYTTLLVDGRYMHVLDPADWVQNQCEQKEQK